MVVLGSFFLEHRDLYRCTPIIARGQKGPKNDWSETPPSKEAHLSPYTSGKVQHGVDGRRATVVIVAQRVYARVAVAAELHGQGRRFIHALYSREAGRRRTVGGIGPPLLAPDLMVLRLPSHLVDVVAGGLSLIILLDRRWWLR